MFFECESISFRLLGVVWLDQTNSKSSNIDRPHSSLSFRLESDTLIETAAGQRLRLGSGTLSYVPAHLNYFRTAVRDRMIVIDFETQDYSSGEFETLVPEDPARYEELFRQILRIWEEKEPGYRFEAAAVLSRIFAALYRDAHAAETSRDRLCRAMRYIERTHLKREFSLQQAAREVCCSEPYFRRLFRQRYGVSPKQYVISLRMQHAAALICAGYHSLQEIAALCGYEDYKYFSVEFKRIMGVSPSQYTG